MEKSNERNMFKKDVSRVSSTGRKIITPKNILTTESEDERPTKKKKSNCSIHKKLEDLKKLAETMKNNVASKKPEAVVIKKSVTNSSIQLKPVSQNPKSNPNNKRKSKPEDSLSPKPSTSFANEQNTSIDSATPMKPHSLEPKSDGNNNNKLNDVALSSSQPSPLSVNKKKTANELSKTHALTISKETDNDEFGREKQFSNLQSDMLETVDVQDVPVLQFSPGMLNDFNFQITVSEQLT
ncbi:uncharacterized protein LOC127280324 [Leptopilina boulardi]|uniref:uncharacterized protein LOC127280324 n=1 Tax=Leptopilina boulardi TaxID=63433 RepID=UPI0021F670EC|nr:uncharacterized protein LOC127280324 [Leptopilina boulardi]